MDVAMMDVGPMNVSMGNPIMHMVLVVRFRSTFLFVHMTVMFILIMLVLMLMGESLVDMEMLMPFPVKAHDANEHQ